MLRRFFITYRKTRGLDAFPEKDQWWTYRKAFNQLLIRDRKFQTMVMSFVAWVLLWCVISNLAMNADIISIPLRIASYALLLIGLLVSCFWFQGVQNRRIAEILPELLVEPEND